MTIKIKNEFFETEYSEILNGLRNIKKKHNYSKVKIMINDDGSGEIQGYDKINSVGFSKLKSFKNYDELLGFLTGYCFVK